MNKATQYYGQRLRSARERLGVSLEAIAESTKIKRSLLADLERGDASKWPPGIYRRAFVRDYAVAIGMPADEVVSEFLELFPEEGASPAPRVAPQPGELRLTIASDPNEAVLGSARRLLASIVELCGVLGAGWLLARFAGWEFWSVSGALALVYYPVVAACTTRAFAFRWPRLRPEFSSSVPSVRDVVQVVLHRSPVRSADERAV